MPGHPTVCSGSRPSPAGRSPCATGRTRTGLAYTAGAGPGEASAQDASAGYDTAALFLASVAVIAAVIAALRGRGTLSHDPALTAE